MAEEVDYESDAAMAMEEEEDTKINTLIKNTDKSDSGDKSPNEDKSRRIKGRGKGKAAMDEERYPDAAGVFEKLDQDESGDGKDNTTKRSTHRNAQKNHDKALKSIEGWILFVTGIHEEAQEEDVLDAFGEHAQVKNIHMNLDRRTGFVKGYALLEFEDFDAAKEAMNRMDEKEILGQKISVNWAFQKDKSGEKPSRRGNTSKEA
uniref:RNA binding protein putative n=1 Tax=Albugo laibachii Nc14 TaxID=890382 RepID=F0WAW6_9STRA|nr:RNA binding protein putative [Albugo laibachii Nc14]CCA18438.1 RNA binding protein putative [Albugo laibachii Nc14]|eukprot:CCA18438.1 RNA binding protein putative [Albugo laibachii Nc14]